MCNVIMTHNGDVTSSDPGDGDVGRDGSVVGRWELLNSEPDMIMEYYASAGKI